MSTSIFHTDIIIPSLYAGLYQCWGWMLEANSVGDKSEMMLSNKITSILEMLFPTIQHDKYRATNITLLSQTLILAYCWLKTMIRHFILTFTVVSEQSWSVNILYSIIATSHKNANFWPCSWTLLNPSSAVFILVEFTTFHNLLHFKLGSRTLWTQNPFTYTVYILPLDSCSQEHNLVWHWNSVIEYGI